MPSSKVVYSALPEAVSREWGLLFDGAELVTGGMNSVTTMLHLPGSRVFAKWVPESGAEDLLRGAVVAQSMSANGIRAGNPIPTLGGALSAPLLGGQLLLMEEVAGNALGSSEGDLWDWGVTLAHIHAVATSKHRADFFPWLREVGTDPARESWVRSAVEQVVAEYDELPSLTWAQLHSDPGPEAFRRNTDGNIGVVDWAGSTQGPVLYDLASAIMYSGNERAGARVVEGYQSVGLIPDLEVKTYLPTFRRFRAAVQAAYFSERIHQANLTGMQDQAENLGGLSDSRLLLREAGMTSSSDA